jgi:hypothetical protein
VEEYDFVHPTKRTPAQRESTKDRTSETGGLEEMDVLVMLEEMSEHSTVLAHVNSVPSPLNSEKPTRDVVTLYGEATSESLAIAPDVIRETANQLLQECGATIRRLVAGLSMPDWPEGSRRAISFTLTSHAMPMTGAGARVDALLEHYRQTDGFTFDNDGD